VTSSLPALPSRVCHADAARERFGDRVDRLLPWLWEADPLADALAAELDAEPGGWDHLGRALSWGIEAVPEASPLMRALFSQLDHVPLWVDFDRIDRAGRLLFRTGALGGIVLGARSLVAGYAAPAGNKPLVLTGQLARDPMHRLAETGRFVAAVCEPGGLRRSGAGFAIAVRVRMMHARVRYLIGQRDDWDAGAWGAPINQHDQLATSLLFSQVWVEGARRFGWQISRSEAEDWLHLWRWCSVVMGVPDELLPTTEPEAVALSAMIRMTQAAPDADSRALVHALLATAPDEAVGQSALAWGFCRGLLEPETADGLGVPRTPWRHIVRAASTLVAPVDRIASRVPWVEAQLVAAGQRHWRDTVHTVMAGRTPEFKPPARLWGHLRRSA
jgi:hypothetical protein